MSFPYFADKCHHCGSFVDNPDQPCPGCDALRRREREHRLLFKPTLFARPEEIVLPRMRRPQHTSVALPVS